MKTMGAMTNNAHHLFLLNGILADGTVIVLSMKSACENRALFNLLCTRVNNNWL
jgi:hypothetical protein